MNTCDRLALANQQIEFFTPKPVGEREWGEELLIMHAPGKYIGKLLKIKAGKKGGLQYHRLKDEADYLLSGQMIVRYVTPEGNLASRVLNPGESVRFPPGAVHQTEALTDCLVFEASTLHFNDRVRVEEIFGLEKSGGLPTTSLGELETW